MGVKVVRTFEYRVRCDACGSGANYNNVVDGVHSKREAVRAYGRFHIVKHEVILCNRCYKLYKEKSWEKTFKMKGIGSLNIRAGAVKAVLRLDPETDEELSENKGFKSAAI